MLDQESLVRGWVGRSGGILQREERGLLPAHPVDLHAFMADDVRQIRAKEARSVVLRTDLWHSLKQMGVEVLNQILKLRRPEHATADEDFDNNANGLLMPEEELLGVCPEERKVYGVLAIFHDLKELRTKYGARVRDATKVRRKRDLAHSSAQAAEFFFLRPVRKRRFSRTYERTTSVD
jgi:hypothetical protein